MAQHDLDEWASKIDDNTRFVYSEMPTNPTAAVFDVEQVADLTHEFGIPLIIDATVATAALMRPLCHGADIVIHSMTKSMIAGGFAIGGAIISKNDIPSIVGPDEMKQDFATYVKLLPSRDHGPTFISFNALMAMNELRNLNRLLTDAAYRSSNEILVDPELGVRAKMPLDRMLAFQA